MIAVFLGFATDPDPVIKMTGVGLATAVLVDVTLVRLLMAPAALTLLGDRLWPAPPRALAPGRRRRKAHGVGTPAADVRPATQRARPGGRCRVPPGSVGPAAA